MYDATKHNPNLSPVVRACTESRLYDGANLTDQQLLDHEEAIMVAQGNEKAFISDLYRKMTDYKDPLFHHDLWYGLVAMGSNAWQEALTALEKVPHRLEYFSKKRQPISKHLQYDRWRIKKYIAEIKNKLQ